MAGRTIPEVYIIETLDVADEEHRREGEVITKVLRMAGKEPRYRYVRTTKELIHFADDFANSGYRYLHISCHGNIDLFGLTLDRLSATQFADVIGPHLGQRRLFLSTCLATTKDFAQLIFDRSECFSIAGPVNSIGFTDAALFWSTFYHLMFKAGSKTMKANAILANMTKVATCIDERIRFFTPSIYRTPVEHLLP
jgi:hypothetical protein